MSKYEIECENLFYNFGFLILPYKHKRQGKIYFDVSRNFALEVVTTQKLKLARKRKWRKKKKETMIRR